MSAIIFRAGKKVILRPIEETDITQLRIWMNDPEVTRYLARVFPLYEKEEAEWFEGLHLKTNHFSFAIVEKETNLLMGTISLSEINWINRTATTGTLLGNKDSWGKGFGTDAKMLLLEYAFNTLDLVAILSRVVSFNGRSLSYARKCGYQEVGRIPLWRRGKDGKRYDEVLLVVTEDTWRPLWEEYSVVKSE